MSKKETSSPKNFAEALRLALDNAGVTAYRLHQLTGIGVASISRFLNGEALPAWEPAIKISLALGITLDELKTPDIQLAPPPPIGSPGRKPKESRS